MEVETTDKLRELVEMHPADVADYLQREPLVEAEALFQQLPTELAAKVLEELEDERANEMLQALPEDKLVTLFRQMPHHVVADFAPELPSEKKNGVLARLPPEEARSVIALLRYPEDTAGGLMSDRFITLRANWSLQQAVDYLRAHAVQRTDDVTYLYVTDDELRLVGVVSLRDLVFRRPDLKVSEIMNPDVKALQVDADQEEMARNFEHYHYLGLPVLDLQGRMVGVVKMSDALQVAQREATEDMQLMVGLSGEERSLTPWRKSVNLRLPWLYVNLLTAVLAASVVGIFEDTIARWTALAVFLPLIAGMGGNAGMQTLTVIIRDLALGELSPGDGRRALMKEVAAGTVNGVAIGIVVGAIGYFWKGSWELGLVAGLAMVLTMVAAALSGVLVPFGLKLFKVDPALAASIFVTTVTDVAGFFFFLGLAVLALRLLE